MSSNLRKISSIVNKPFPGFIVHYAPVFRTSTFYSLTRTIRLYHKADTCVSLPQPQFAGTNKKRYHASVVPAGRISTDRLAKEIQKECTLTVADVKSVLIALADKLGEHLGEGRKVHLDGIGYFQGNLRCKEEVRTTHDARSENIEFKNVSFRADIDLKEKLKSKKIRHSRNKPHSMTTTEKDIDEKLTAYFASNPILTRRDFQHLCTLVKATACRTLRKLVEDGKLKNISSQHNPVYVPDNGHYAPPVQGE